MTPETLKRLAELSRMLDQATGEYGRLDEAAVVAKQAFEVAYARVFLTTEGAVDFRKQTAILECADERLAAEIAQARVRAVHERIRTLRAQIEVGRSMNAAFRSEFVAGSSVT